VVVELRWRVRGGRREQEKRGMERGADGEMKALEVIKTK